MKLPPFQLWNGQVLPLQQANTILLSDCHPTHSLGEAMSVACIDDSSEPSLSRFAILCRSHDVDIAVTPAAAASPRFDFAFSPIVKERASPILCSPGVLNRSSSPSPIMMDRGGPQAEWTDKETHNAVLRARRALRSHNSNISPCKTRPVKPDFTPQSSLQPFDESVIMTTPATGKKRIEVLFSSDSEANEIDETIASPATALLDMTTTSDIWMKNSPAPYIGAFPLAGLNFISGESPMESTPLSRHMLLPPRSRRINFQTPGLQRGQSDASTTRPDKLAYLVLVTLEPRHQGGSQSPAFVCKTFVASLPQHLSSFSAIDIKLKTSSLITSDEENRSDLLFSPSPGKSFVRSNAEGEPAQSLILSVQSPSTQRIHVLSFALTKIGLTPSEPEESHDLKEIIKDQVIGDSSQYTIRSLVMDDLRLDEDNLHIRVVFAAKPISAEFEEESKGLPFNLSTTEDFGVAVATFMLPFPTADPREPPATVAVAENPSCDKLDTILNAFKRFETNVTERLDRMEKAIQENNVRVTNMEKLIQEQAKAPYVPFNKS